MKLTTVLAVLLLASCAHAPNHRPTQVTSSLQYGAIPVTASGVKVTSGNYRAISPGQAGDGAE